MNNKYWIQKEKNITIDLRIYSKEKTNINRRTEIKDGPKIKILDELLRIKAN